jgi:hypothetical protein
VKRTVRHNPSGRAGQVLVVILLAMALLAGLLMFVYNLGDQLNRRVSTQNAADGAAISGAAWMARSMTPGSWLSLLMAKNR